VTTEQNDKLDRSVQEEPVVNATSSKRSSGRKVASGRGAGRVDAKAKTKAVEATGTKRKTKVALPKKATQKKSARAKTSAGAAKGEVVSESQDGSDGKSGPASLPRLQARFRSDISPQLLKEFKYTSPMQVPKLSKVVLNIGLGEALENAKAIENATNDLSLISGQRPIATRARKSIANFKVREGMVLGLAVSLRGRRMYEFFDRLISSALPRIRDFRGISRKSFDGRGNYTLGIREQVIFPEIDYNSIDRIRGLQVVVVTTARTDQEGLRLLELMGVPFTRDGEGSTVAYSTVT